MGWLSEFANGKSNMLGDTLKKKACSFILEKCGDGWLKQKEYNIDQLTLDLYNGRVQFRNLELDATKINHKLRNCNLPFEFIDCFVGCLDVSVPWSSIFSDASQVEIKNLEITLRHCIKSSKRDFQLSLMKSSLRLAEECMEKEKGHDIPNMSHFEGLHQLAAAFEAIFARTKGIITDVTICFEHIHDKYTTIFELKIAKVEYFGKESEQQDEVPPDLDKDSKKQQTDKEKDTIRIKNLVFHGVKIYVGVDGELKKFGTSICKGSNVDKILLVDFLGEPKIRITCDEEGNKSKIEPCIEGLNVILSPQVVRYLYKIFCEPPQTSPTEASFASLVLKGSENEFFHSCVSEPTVCNPVQYLRAKKIDPSSTEISLVISFISVVLLHSDGDDNDDGRLWHDDLRSLEDDFLKVIRGMSQSEVLKASDLVETRNAYSNVLDRSHFSLLIKQAELKATSSPLSESTLDLDLTLGLFDLSEVIVGEKHGKVDYCEWLSFKEGLLELKSTGEIGIVEPSIKLKVSSTQKLVDNILSSDLLVAMTMSKCMSELDVTVMNRIQPIRAALTPTNRKQHHDEVETGNSSFAKVSLSLECEHWTPLIRFPKAGPIESLDLSRQLHEEFLWVDIQNLNVKTGATSRLDQLHSLEICFSSARANLIVKEDVHRLISIKSEGVSDSSSVAIKFNPRSKVTGNQGPAHNNEEETDLIFSELGRAGEAPFSSKRRTFKDRDLVEPAKRQEMTSHHVEESNNSKVSVDVCLQQVVFYFPSKAVLDLFQNKLLNDALSWQVVTPDHIKFDSIVVGGSEVSRPEAADDETGSPEVKVKRNAACIFVNIKEGRISLGMTEIPNSRIFALAVSNFSFLCIPRYHGDQESWSLSAQSENLEFSIESHESGRMFTKILQTSKDCFGLDDDKSAKDALSVAAVISKGKGHVHYKMAVALRNCILYHLEAPTNEKLWVTQLTDLLTAIGLGSDPKTVNSSPSGINSTSELHFSLKNCAFEYKPSSLAYHVVLLNKSSHVTTRNDLELEGHEFSIYVEESGLFLGMKQPGVKKIDLRKDFVCVADINSVDFTLRQLNKFDKKRPQTKLSASINRFNLYTCSDSFAALSQIIIHLSSSVKAMSPPERQSDEKKENGKATSDAVMEMNVENEDVLMELIGDATKYNYMPPSKYTIPNRKRNDSATLDEKPIINVRSDFPFEFESNSFVDLLSETSSIHERSSDPKRQPPSSVRIPKEKLNFVENHFGNSDPEVRESNLPSIPVEKYHLHDTTLTWYMFGGKDLAGASKDPQKKSVRSDRRRQKGIAWKEFCGPGRDQAVLMEFHVKKIQALHEVYAEDDVDHSRDVLFIREVEVLDRLQVSSINKFLYPCITPTSADNCMLKICARHVRDETNILKKECILKISLTPIKLNIDQDSLSFICEFINGVTERVLIPPQSSDKVKLKKVVQLGMSGPSSGAGKELQQIYFRSVKFSPDVVIRIDYRGKMADRGSMKGLLASILHLDQSEIVLKRVNYRNGIRGIEKLMTLLMEEWAEDIRKNQLGKMIRGIGPAGTIFNIAKGVKNLFSMPVQQYRKDGRVVMGLQKGAYSFALYTLASSLELAYKSFHVLQCLSQFAHDVVAQSDDDDDDDVEGAETSQRMKTPEDLREGFVGACAIVKKGLNDRAFEMRDALSRKHHQKGVAKTIGGILKQVPQTVIDPILVASKATTNLLEGARNQMLPEVKKEQMEKWKAR